MSIKHQISQEVANIASSPKVATGIVAATTGSGVGTWLDWIPNDIGKLASLVGIVLSLVLIAVHVTVFRKHRLELEMLKEEQRKRRAEDKL